MKSKNFAFLIEMKEEIVRVLLKWLNDKNIIYLI